MSKSIIDQLTEGAAAIVRDIREKVVEEGWFGRVVTGEHDPGGGAASGSAPMQGGDAPTLWQEQVRQVVPEKDIPSPEPGLDR